ncbi:MAG TPA: hypothetical protein VL854_05695 [Nitrososphaeraceae archaeon]|nr:hypothetical protein [Nitrososphaeraceae archaeon]
MVKRVVTIEFTEGYNDENIEHNSFVRGCERLTLRQMDILITTLQHVRYLHAIDVKKIEELLHTQA